MWLQALQGWGTIRCWLNSPNFKINKFHLMYFYLCFLSFLHIMSAGKSLHKALNGALLPFLMVACTFGGKTIQFVIPLHAALMYLLNVCLPCGVAAHICTCPACSTQWMKQNRTSRNT